MDSTPLVGNKISNSLVDNKAKCDKYYYHIGLSTSQTIKEMAKSDIFEDYERTGGKPPEND